MNPPRPSTNPMNAASEAEGSSLTGDATSASLPTGPPQGCEFLAPPQQPDEIGRLGKYRILGLLGAGGMGTVFRAEDPTLRRPVALKVMLPQVASNPLAKARFLREARAQAKVEHLNIITIHHIGEDRGIPYLAMPLLKGQTLAAALKQNPRPPIPELLRIGREIAEGLAAAHEHHLVHRDIKPANIWLEGNRRRVKILDFGLARAETDAEMTGESEPVTREGAVIGTPAYMSPEQARGDPVDARTDLFSLGVVLYQMAVGELPFKGNNAMAILMSLGVDTPEHPSVKNPEVPIALGNLIQRLLAKPAAERPSSAEAVVAELDQIQPGMLPSAVLAPGAAAEHDPWADLDFSDPGEIVQPAPIVNAAPLALLAAPRSSKKWLVLGGGIGALLFLALGLIALRDSKPKPEDVPRPVASAPPVAPLPTDFALAYDGTDRCIIPEFALPPTAPVTLEAYFTPRLETTVGSPILLGQRNAINLNLSGTTIKTFHAKTPMFGPSYTRDRRIHAALVRTASEVHLFIDGKKVGSKPVSETTIPVNKNPWSIGEKNFNGLIDEIRISKTARYDKDFTPASRFERDADTLALYHCDEGQGDRLTDSSGNGHHGKLEGVKWERPDSKPPSANVPIDPSKVPIVLPLTPEQEAAEWILNTGGTIRVILAKGKPGEEIFSAEEFKPNALFHEIALGADSSPDAEDAAAVLSKVPAPCWDSYALFIANHLTDEGVRRLAGIPFLTGVRSLNLTSSRMTDAVLASVGAFPKLESLTVSRTAVTGSGFPLLKDHPALRNLNLSNSNVDVAHLATLADLPLRTLKLDGNKKIDDSTVPMLSRVTTLRHLNVSQTAITNDGAQALAKALPQCEIVSDHGTVLGGKTILLARPTLKALHAAGVSIMTVLVLGSPIELKDPSSPNANSLVHAMFFESSKTRFTDQDDPAKSRAGEEIAGMLKEMPAAAWAPNHSRLRFNVPITAQGWAALAAVPSLRWIEEVVLGFGHGSDEAVSALAKLPRVTLLEIRRTRKLTDAGMKEIARMGFLRHLTLDETAVTDAGAAELAPLKLEHLTLSKCRVSDESIPWLSRMTTLKSLDLRNTQVSAAGLAKLTSALPGCQIEWNGVMLGAK